MKIHAESGGFVVTLHENGFPLGMEQGEQMLHAVAVLGKMFESCTFEVDGEHLSGIRMEGWIARKANRNTILGFEPSKTLLQEWNRLEASTGQPWELRVKTIKGLGRTSFLRPRRYQKHG